MFNQKSVLARLLANENITVQQGNYDSAYFDVKSRTLGIPLRKDMSKDVLDLLVGHEVSHALFTPSDFNKYMSEGIPHSWLNIVEDVRIEKLILRKYPGLVSNFKRGYNELMFGDYDLFNVKGLDFKKMNFMDRLNVHAKARDMVNVPFTDEEIPFVNQAKACETYEEVVQCCRDIQAWLGEKGEDQKSEEVELDPDMLQSLLDQMAEDTPESQSDDQSQEEGDEEGEGEGSSTQETDEEGDEESEETGSGEGNETDEESDSEESNSSEGEETADEEGETSDEVAETPELPSGNATEEAFTDQAYQDNQKDLVEGKSKAYVEGIKAKDLSNIVIPYSVVAELRQKRIEVIKKHESHYYLDKECVFPTTEFNAWMTDTKRVVNLMVKEFEMRKAAFRSARARTSTRGTLDVNKLHKYKYEDNLFKQARQLADAKNHGMLMVIDYSGSMHRMMPAVIKQTLALAMFCKRVGIPFEVYNFTTFSSRDSDHPFIAKMIEAKKQRKIEIRDGVTTFDFEELAMCELMNSSMRKSEYEMAQKMLFWQTVGRYMGPGTSSVEELGSTPLNAALMASVHLLKKFRAKHAVEKMNLVTLTDGDSNYPHTSYGNDLYVQRDGAIDQGERWTTPDDYMVNVDGKLVEYSGRRYYGGNSRKFTTGLLDVIKGMGVTTLNYYVAERAKDFTYQVRGMFGWDDTVLRAARKELREKGVYTVDNQLGYSRRFVLMNEQVGAEVEELEVNSSMTAAQAARAFKKSSSSKKKSRVITQKFAEIVA